MTVRYTRDGWNIQRTHTPDGCVYEYQRQVTLTGAAQNIDLPIHYPASINRISYYINNANAKSFTTRIFNGGTDLTSYDEVGAWVLNVDLSLTYTPLGEEGRYTQTPIIIRTALTASTAGDLFTVKVVTRRLE